MGRVPLKFTKSIICTLAITAVAALSSQSCFVDRDLDLNKEIDKKVTVVPGFSVPFGGEGTVRIDAILRGISWTTNIIPSKNKTTDFDAAGNLVYVIDSTTVSCGEFLPQSLLEGQFIQEEMNDSFSFTVDGDRIRIPISTEKTFTAKGPQISPAVAGIRNLETEDFGQYLELHFSVPGAAEFTIEKGFRVELPSWMTVRNVTEPEFLSVEGTHTIVTIQDINLSEGDPFPIDVVTSGLELPQSALPTTNRIDIQSRLSWSGTMTVPSSAKPEGSLANVKTSLLYSTEYVYLHSAEVLLSDSIPLPDKVFSPSLLNLGKPYVKPSDLQISMSCDNRLDSPVDINANLNLSFGLSFPIAPKC